MLIHSLDITGATLSLLSTILYIRTDKNAWPIAIITILINICLYLQTGLYADAGKDSIYLILSAYGWYCWTHGRQQNHTSPIRQLTAKHGLLLSAIAAISIFALSLFLTHFTNSQVPRWDATTTILSLTAQWLLCRKIIQCWILWFIVDALYVGLYFYKGIPAHALLLMLYVGLAIVGYLHWKKLRLKAIEPVPA